MFNVSLHGPTGLPYSADPAPFVPIEPDYGICDRRYGSNLTPLLCGWAAKSLIEGDSLLPYAVRSVASGPETLPYTAMFGEQSLSSELFDLSYSFWQATARYGSK